MFQVSTEYYQRKTLNCIRDRQNVIISTAIDDHQMIHKSKNQYFYKLSTNYQYYIISLHHYYPPLPQPVHLPIALLLLSLIKYPNSISPRKTTHLHLHVCLWTSPLSGLQQNLKYPRYFSTVPTSNLIPTLYQPGFLKNVLQSYPVITNICHVSYGNCPILRSDQQQPVYFTWQHCIDKGD